MILPKNFYMAIFHVEDYLKLSSLLCYVFFYLALYQLCRQDTIHLVISKRLFTEPLLVLKLTSNIPLPLGKGILLIVKFIKAFLCLGEQLK